VGRERDREPLTPGGRGICDRSESGWSCLRKGRRIARARWQVIKSPRWSSRRPNVKKLDDDVTGAVNQSACHYGAHLLMHFVTLLGWRARCSPPSRRVQLTLWMALPVRLTLWSDMFGCWLLGCYIWYTGGAVLLLAVPCVTTHSRPELACIYQLSYTNFVMFEL